MAYTASVTSLLNKVERISKSLGVYCGKVNVTEYHATLLEITGITKFFKAVTHTGAEPVKYPHGVLAVTPNGLSDNGHMFEWNATSGAFKVYKPTAMLMNSVIGATSAVVQADVAGGTGVQFHATTCVTGAVIAAVGAEVANACDCGEVNFTAIGFAR